MGGLELGINRKSGTRETGENILGKKGMLHSLAELHPPAWIYGKEGEKPVKFAFPPHLSTTVCKYDLLLFCTEKIMRFWSTCQSWDITKSLL